MAFTSRYGIHKKIFLLADCFLMFPRPTAIAGAPLVSIGLFIFAWTTYSHIHWIVPIVGSGLFGAGYVV